MPRSVFKDLKTFTKNISRHAEKVFRRRESMRDALAGVASDTKKLGKHASSKKTAEHRKAAMKLVKQGREAYNARNDTLAESLFRDAVIADETCALAHAYLGHALYRQGRTTEAENAWRRATMVEPGSDGADKAFRSLQRLDKKKKSYNEYLDDRLRNG